MNIERGPNVDILKNISFREATVPQEYAFHYLTQTTRDCFQDSVQYFRDGAKVFGTSFVEESTQLLLQGMEDHQGGLVLDEQHLNAYYAQVGNEPFVNVIRRSVQNLAYGLSKYPTQQDELCGNAMNLFSDVFRLLKPPFTFDDGAHILTEAFQEQDFPPFYVGKMVDYTINFQMPTPISPEGTINRNFDRRGAERLRKIYTHSLTPKDRMQFIRGSVRSAAMTTSARYGVSQN